MFDIGFSEVLLIFVIALVVLGPEKLPRVASQVGRWVGRARAMARQFREQLEEEVNLEEVRKARETKQRPAEPPPERTESKADSASRVGDDAPGHFPEAAQEQPVQPSQPQQAPFTTVPDPVDLRADTFSHAHPTDEYGANPLTPDGGPDGQGWLTQPGGTASAAPSPAPAPDEAGSQAEALTNSRKPDLDGEKHISNTPSTITPTAESASPAVSSETWRPGNPGPEEHGRS